MESEIKKKQNNNWVNKLCNENYRAVKIPHLKLKSQPLSFLKSTKWFIEYKTTLYKLKQKIWVERVG